MGTGFARLFVLSAAIGAACNASSACDDAQSCITAAQQAQAEERYADAAEFFGKATQFVDDSPRLYNAQGSVAFMAGMIEESITAFDRAIELSPGAEPHHWQRGISHYYADRLEDCVAQFDLHRTVNPNDVENSVWHFLCVAKMSGVEKAREDFLPVSGDARVPMREVALLFRGDGSVEAIEEAAERDGSTSAAFYADLYLGLYYETIGDEAAAAHHINAAVEHDSSRHYMWQVARVHKQLRSY